MSVRTTLIWSLALIALTGCAVWNSTEPWGGSIYDAEATQHRLDTLNAQLFSVQPYYSAPGYDSYQEDRRAAEQRAQEAEQRQREAERAAEVAERAAEYAERRLRALQQRRQPG